MTSAVRRAGSGLLAAGVCLSVLGSASTAYAATSTATSSTGAMAQGAPATDWFKDPLTSAQRTRLARVPAHPAAGDRNRSIGTRTRALHRTASGDLAVPAKRVRGHQLVAGQAVVAPVRFASRSAALSRAARAALAELRSSTELVGALRCEGHNDYLRNAPASGGSRLARARAAAVCAALDDDRAQVGTTAVSAGAARPIVIGPHRRAGFDPRTLNRRVIVAVTADQAPVVVAPSAVDLATAVPGDGEATLTFSAPTDDGDAEITGYEVSTDAGTSWSELTYTGTGPYTAVLGGLANATTYTLTVRAVNSAGPGAASGGVAVTPAAPVSPASAPTLMWPHTDGGNDVHFGISSPSSDGGSAITGFEYSLDGGDWTAIAPNEITEYEGEYDAHVNPAGFNSGACGQSHQLQVRAVTAAGPGTPSATSPVDCF